MMLKPIRKRVLLLAIPMALMGGATAQPEPKPVASGQDGTLAYPDGTVVVNQLRLPPSDYWSPKFREAYARMAAYLVAHPSFAQPKADAPKAEWDAYDASCAARQADTLTWQKANYNVQIEDRQLGGVRVGIVSPQDGVAAENDHRILIELHGGSCGGLDGLTEAIPIAHFGKIKVVSVAYRATPREPYPASLDDVISVYKALLQSYKPQQIGLLGTSGGGMLVSQALSRLQREGDPQPGATGIFWAGIMGHPYPFGKFGDAEIWVSGFPRSDLADYRKLIDQLAQYIRTVPADDAVAYPLSSDSVLRKFPPTLFLTGTRALDQGAAVTSHARLLKLGVDSSLYVMEGGWHAASYGTFGSPEEEDVNRYVGRWFAAHLAK